MHSAIDSLQFTTTTMHNWWRQTINYTKVFQTETFYPIFGLEKVTLIILSYFTLV